MAETSDPRPLSSSEVLRDARAIFGIVLADQMACSEDVPVAFAEELDLSVDGTEVTMRFGWCGREMLGSVDDTSELRGVVEQFALDVADDLKEHRGRGERLPWDKP